MVPFSSQPPASENQLLILKFIETPDYDDILSLLSAYITKCTCFDMTSIFYLILTIKLSVIFLIISVCIVLQGWLLEDFPQTREQVITITTTTNSKQCLCSVKAANTIIITQSTFYN